METTHKVYRLNKNGTQMITIPKKVTEDLHIQEGDYIFIDWGTVTLQHHAQSLTTTDRRY